MGCCHNEQCVCNILRRIVEAQPDEPCKDCKVSCENSIKQLLSPADLNTIPIMLICKEDCDFYIGKGIFKDKVTMDFRCFQTSIFRVKKVIDKKDADCLAELELLQGQTNDGKLPPSTGECGICSLFPPGITKFIRTGITITVNLSCFCGIECLPPVHAECGTPIPTPSPSKIFQEEICGNFGPGVATVWQAPSNNDYIQGTFQIFNSESSEGNVDATITATPPVAFPPVQPGITISRSANKPTAFDINVPAGTHGTYCIVLYKRVPL